MYEYSSILRIAQSIVVPIIIMQYEANLPRQFRDQLQPYDILPPTLHYIAKVHKISWLHNPSDPQVTFYVWPQCRFPFQCTFLTCNICILIPHILQGSAQLPELAPMMSMAKGWVTKQTTKQHDIKKNYHWPYWPWAQGEAPCMGQLENYSVTHPPKAVLRKIEEDEQEPTSRGLPLWSR